MLVIINFWDDYTNNNRDRIKDVSPQPTLVRAVLNPADRSQPTYRISFPGTQCCESG